MEVLVFCAQRSSFGSQIAGGDLADPSHDCPELSADCSSESESHDHSKNVLCADIESLSSTQVRGVSFPNTGPAASR